MDNKTLRATILLAAHGAVVTTLLTLANQHAGGVVSAAYAAMAIPSGLGLLAAWHALTLLGRVNQGSISNSEFWIGASAIIMAFVVHGMIAAAILSSLAEPQ
jgi:hypothetical protein